MGGFQCRGKIIAEAQPAWHDKRDTIDNEDMVSDVEVATHRLTSDLYLSSDLKKGGRLRDANTQARRISWPEKGKDQSRSFPVTSCGLTLFAIHDSLIDR
ncbi:hypothetical protein KCV06_g168, partial [Aureobasidium melanogenum]